MRAYTHVRLRPMVSSQAFRQPLTLEERLYYMEFFPALQGSRLVVYDIGAAHGSFSRCLAKLAGVDEVHAFEPLADGFAELRQNTAQFPAVRCHNVALGDVETEADMVVWAHARDASSLLGVQTGASNGLTPAPIATTRQSVRVVKLDDYVAASGLPMPDVVKIDVQGYEDRVLRGGARTIGSARFCIVEVSFLPSYEHAALFEDVHALMRAMGFCLVSINNAPTGYQPVLASHTGRASGGWRDRGA
jgi:FkbM family methyltransferase